jgi:hypothetical protein
MSFFLKLEDWFCKISSFSVFNVTKINRWQYLCSLIIFFSLPLISYFQSEAYSDAIQAKMFMEGTAELSSTDLKILRSAYPNPYNNIFFYGSIQAFIFIILLPIFLIKRLRALGDITIKFPAFNFLTLRALTIGPSKIQLKPNLNLLNLLIWLFLSTFLVHCFVLSDLLYSYYGVAILSPVHINNIRYELL